MLIGAFIGFSVYSVIVMLTMAATQRQVDRHNNVLNGALARLYGQAKMTVDYGMLTFKAVAFTSIGAVIGYFI